MLRFQINFLFFPLFNSTVKIFLSTPTMFRLTRLSGKHWLEEVAMDALFWPWWRFWEKPASQVNATCSGKSTRHLSVRDESSLIRISRGPWCTLFQSDNTFDLWSCTIQRPPLNCQLLPLSRDNKKCLCAVCVQSKSCIIYCLPRYAEIWKGKIKVGNLFGIFYGNHMVDGIPVTSISPPSHFGSRTVSAHAFCTKKTE